MFRPLPPFHNLVAEFKRERAGGLACRCIGRVHERLHLELENPSNKGDMGNVEHGTRGWLCVAPKVHIADQSPRHIGNAKLLRKELAFIRGAAVEPVSTFPERFVCVPFESAAIVAGYIHESSAVSNGDACVHLQDVAADKAWSCPRAASVNNI